MTTREAKLSVVSAVFAFLALGGCSTAAESAHDVVGTFVYRDNFQRNAEGQDCAQRSSEVPDVSLVDESGTLIGTPRVTPGKAVLVSPSSVSDVGGTAFYAFECTFTLNFDGVKPSKFYVFRVGKAEKRFSAQDMAAANWQVSLGG